MSARIILQDLASHHYLTEKGDWIASCQEARNFEHTYVALLEGLQHRLRRTQVVWCFRNPAANFYVSVHPSDADKVYPCVTCPLLGIQPPNEPVEIVFASSSVSLLKRAGPTLDR